MTPELTDEQLRDGLRAIAEWGAPSSAPPISDVRTTPRALPVRAQRGRPLWWATAAAFVAVVVGLTALVGRAEPLPVADGVWVPMAASPIPARANPATVWTGSEVIVVGGESVDGTIRRDAAAYEPARNAWRLLPPAPADVFPGATAVWAAGRVVIVHDDPSVVKVAEGQSPPPPWPPPGAMTLDPKTGLWAQLPDIGFVHAAAAVEGRVVVLRRHESGAPEFAAVDPATGATETIAMSPRRDLDFDFVRGWRGFAAGGRAVFVSGEWMPMNVAAEIPVGFVVDVEARAIDEIAQPPMRGVQGRPAFVITEPVMAGERFVATPGLVFPGDGDTRQAMARYDLAERRWRMAEPLRKLPTDEALFKSTRFTAVPGALIATGGIAMRDVISDLDGGALHVAYVGDRDQWVDIPEPRIDLARVGHVAVGTGDGVVVWGGLRETQGSINRADRPARGGAVYRFSAEASA